MIYLYFFRIKIKIKIKIVCLIETNYIFFVAQTIFKTISGDRRDIVLLDNFDVSNIFKKNIPVNNNNKYSKHSK